MTNFKQELSDFFNYMAAKSEVIQQNAKIREKIIDDYLKVAGCKTCHGFGTINKFPDICPECGGLGRQIEI